ncbi:MAG: hypothetical protein ABH859_00895 [Pseudomonadota bacterium]
MDYQRLSESLGRFYQLDCELQERTVFYSDDCCGPGEAVPEPQVQQYLSCTTQEDSGLGDIYVHIAREGEYQRGGEANSYDIICHSTINGGSCYIGGRTAENFYGPIQFSLISDGQNYNQQGALFTQEWTNINARIRAIYTYLDQHVSFAPIIPSTW